MKYLLFLSIFFADSFSSTEGEGDSSLFVISFSATFCSTTGGSKKVAQKTNTNVI